MSRVEEIKNIYESRIKGEYISQTEKGTSATSDGSPGQLRGQSRVSSLRQMFESMSNKK